MKFKSSTLDSFIFVGDMHVKKDNIEESKRLIKWIEATAQEHQVPVLFSGDQYNDFSIARIEVADFWDWAFSHMKSPVIALAGNHDGNPDMSLNFMDRHKGRVMVISEPTEMDSPTGKVLLMPYRRQNEVFISEVQHSEPTYLIHHQEFNGAMYENGFYSPHGVDPAELPQTVKWAIGGHIHKEQEFGVCLYPGTPRHLTRSDVGEEKGIHLISLSKKAAGQPAHTKLATPEEVSEPFKYVQITPEFSGDISEYNSSRTYVDLKGPKAFVDSMLGLVDKNVKLRTFPESEAVEVEVKESDGIPKAFMDYAMKYAEKHGLGAAEIKVVLKKIYDKCPSLKVNL